MTRRKLAFIEYYSPVADACVVFLSLTSSFVLELLDFYNNSPRNTCERICLETTWMDRLSAWVDFVLHFNTAHTTFLWEWARTFCFFERVPEKRCDQHFGLSGVVTLNQRTNSSFKDWFSASILWTRAPNPRFKITMSSWILPSSIGDREPLPGLHINFVC